MVLEAKVPSAKVSEQEGLERLPESARKRQPEGGEPLAPSGSLGG